MPFIGAAINAAKGLYDGHKLNRRRAALSDLADVEIMSLLPEGYRKYAELRLKVYEDDIESTEHGAQSVLDKYESVRAEELERLMEELSSQHVTRDEMARLVHSLAEHSHAAAADIEQIDRQTTAWRDEICAAAKLEAEKTSNDIEKLESDLSLTAKDLTALVDHEASDLRSKLAESEASLSAAIRVLSDTAASLRVWLMVLTAVSAIEGFWIFTRIMK